MKSSIVLVLATFLNLVAFPTTTVGKHLSFWPNPSEISRNEMLSSTAYKFNYGDSKIWKCTYSNGSAPAISISPSTPSLPPPTPTKSQSPSPPPSSSSYRKPSNPSQEHHHHHHHQKKRWGHINKCMRNIGHVTMCRVQMEISFYSKMFQVSDKCCKAIVNMKNECDDVVWGLFTDPFFVPLVRYTCHVAVS